MARKYGDQNGISKPDKKSFFGDKGTPVNERFAQADYGDAKPELVHTLVRVVVAGGGGVLFSRTSDGGAFSITFFMGDERRKVYTPGALDIDETLREWITFFSSAAEQK
jgi:hypothetical protein